MYMYSVILLNINFIYLFMCMDVVSSHPWRPEEDTGTPGTEL